MMYFDPLGSSFSILETRPYKIDCSKSRISRLSSAISSTACTVMSYLPMRTLSLMSSILLRATRRVYQRTTLLPSIRNASRQQSFNLSHHAIHFFLIRQRNHEELM